MWSIRMCDPKSGDLELVLSLVPHGEAGATWGFRFSSATEPTETQGLAVADHKGYGRWAEAW